MVLIRMMDSRDARQARPDLLLLPRCCLRRVAEAAIKPQARRAIWRAVSRCVSGCPMRLLCLLSNACLPPARVPSSSSDPAHSPRTYTQASFHQGAKPSKSSSQSPQPAPPAPFARARRRDHLLDQQPWRLLLRSYFCSSSSPLQPRPWHTSPAATTAAPAPT